jgi:tetratricopeptide (TPR) repeat protein
MVLPDRAIDGMFGARRAGVKLEMVAAWLFLASAAVAQDVDSAIQKDIESVLELAAAPREATEDQRKAKVEAFKAALLQFAQTWEPRAAELQSGRYPLGRGLMLLGRPDQAIPHLEHFVKSQPKSEDIEEATLLLGGAYLDARRHDRAIAVYEEFLASRPSSSQRIVARYYLAITRIESGQNESGLAELQEISKSATEHTLVADAKLKVVQTLGELGRAPEAREQLAGLLKERPDAPALLAQKEQLDWVGRTAPEFDGVRTWLNGPGKALGELRGSVVVMTFFAEPYDASRAELVRIRELSKVFSGKPVSFVGITTYYRKKTRPLDDEDRLLAEFLGAQEIKVPIGVVLDFRMLQAYGVRGVPHTVVIGSDGAVEYLKIGASRSDRRGVELLKAAIERALSRVK